MLGGLNHLCYGCSQVIRCSSSNSPNYTRLPWGNIVFSFHGVQVLVVQASEAPHNSRSTIMAAEPAGRSLWHDATVKNVTDNSAILSSKAASGATYRAREIVAYDDLF